MGVLEREREGEDVMGSDLCNRWGDNEALMAENRALKQRIDELEVKLNESRSMPEETQKFLTEQVRKAGLSGKKPVDALRAMYWRGVDDSLEAMIGRKQ